MTGDPWRPTPPEIDRDPEVALLAALDHALDVAAAAILAAHPNLVDDEAPYRQLHRPEVRAADAILTHARRLRDALRRYRQATAALHADPSREPTRAGDPDDIPF